MQNLTPLQIEVYNEAKYELKKNSWYRGVCCDDFPSDKEIEADIEAAIRSVIIITEYWDAP